MAANGSTALRAAPVEALPAPAPIDAAARAARVPAPALGPARAARELAAAPASNELAKVLRWTLGIPAVALVAFVGLYVLGAIWTWGEVQDAGLVPTDVLALVPHSQILGRGAQLLVLALIALPLPLAFAWLLDRILPRRGKPWGVPSPLARLIADHQRLRRDLDELRGEPTPDQPALEKRVRRLHTRARRQTRAQQRSVWATRIAIGLALAAGLVVLTPARLAVALFGLWLMRQLTLSRLRLVLAVFGVLVVAVAAERFTAPDPLPQASVRTTNGALVKGPLVAATDDAWHVVVGERRVKTIPAVNIAKSSAYSESRLVRGPLGARVIDAFR